MADLITRSDVIDEELIKEMLTMTRSQFDDAMVQHGEVVDDGIYYFIEGPPDSKVLVSVPYASWTDSSECLLEFNERTVKSNRLSAIPLYTAMFLQGYGLDIDIVSSSVPIALPKEYNMVVNLGGVGVSCKHTPTYHLDNELSYSGFETDVELGVADINAMNNPPVINVGLGIYGEWLRYLEWLVQINRIAHFIKWNETIVWAYDEPVQSVTYLDSEQYECQDCYYHVTGEKINDNGGHCPYCGSDSFISKETY